MTYYKIIQDNQVIDAGFVFLKWNERRHRLNLCDEGEAQFVQSYNQTKTYRDQWLKPIPECNVKYEMAQVVVINKSEYDEIRNLLDGDEQIPVLPDIPEEEKIVEPEKPVEETPLSIADMRRLIQQQQKQLSILTERLAIVSETIKK